MPHKKKANRRIPKEARKNLKMWAEGAREQVLTPHVELYADASLRGWKAERDYWQSVCNEFHARISWRLKDHEEPTLPLPDYDSNAMSVDEVLTAEERIEQLARIKELNDRIRRWLKARVRRLHQLWNTTAGDPRKNPYAVFMAKLSGVVSPPKARQAYQQFMVERYSSDIDPVARSKWQVEILAGRQPSDSRPNAAFRAKVSRDLFQKLPPAEQVEYAKTARVNAAAAKDKYEKEIKLPPSKKPTETQRCIDKIPGFLGPVIDGIQERTGLKFFIMYGGPCPVNEGEITSWHMNFGFNKANQPVSFSQYQKDDFKQGTYALWTEWLSTCYTPEDIKQAALRPELDDGEEPDLTGLDPDSSSEESGEEDEEDDHVNPLESIMEDLPAKKRARLEKPHAQQARRITSPLPSPSLPATSSPSSPLKSLASHVAPPSQDTLLTQLLHKAAVKRPGNSIIFSPPPTTPSSQTSQTTAGLVSAAITHSPPVPVAAIAGSPTSPSATEPPNAYSHFNQASPVSAPKAPSPLAHDTQSILTPMPGHGGVQASSISTFTTASAVDTASPQSPALPEQFPPSPSGSKPTLSTSTNVDADQDSPPLKKRKASIGWIRHRTVTPTPSKSAGSKRRLFSSPPSLPLTKSAFSSLTPGAELSTPSPSRLADISTSLPSSSSVSHPPTPIQSTVLSSTPTPTPSSSSNSFPLCPTPATPAESWIRDAFTSVTTQDLSQDYAEVVRLFIAIEAAHKYANPSRGLPTKRRPAEVTKWVGSGRWRGKPPTITNPGKFSDCWWAWWLSLQPLWRTYGPTGKPVIADAYGDEWDTLVYPGQNGILSIVACLSWWGCAITHSQSDSCVGAKEDWLTAVRDVRWVLDGLLLHLS